MSNNSAENTQNPYILATFVFESIIDNKFYFILKIHLLII